MMQCIIIVWVRRKLCLLSRIVGVELLITLLNGLLKEGTVWSRLKTTVHKTHGPALNLRTPWEKARDLLVFLNTRDDSLFTMEDLC